MAGPADRRGESAGHHGRRKVGNAVVRNRFKRRIREWFRQHRGELPDALDMVVIARRSGAELSFGELDQRMRDLLRLRQAGGR
ncbi:MAG: ribonuclease P protein component [Myxococcota bacterium]